MVVSEICCHACRAIVYLSVRRLRRIDRSSHGLKRQRIYLRTYTSRFNYHWSSSFETYQIFCIDTILQFSVKNVWCVFDISKIICGSGEIVFGTHKRIWIYILNKHAPPLGKPISVDALWEAVWYDEISNTHTRIHVFPPSIMHYLITSTSPISQRVTQVIVSNANGRYIYEYKNQFNI